MIQSGGVGTAGDTWKRHGAFGADGRGVGRLGLGLGLLRKRTISWCFAPKKPRTDR